MEKVKKILWRVVPDMKWFLIFSKTISFSYLLFPAYISWLLRLPPRVSHLLFPYLLSWPLFIYILATLAYHSFTNPVILSWIFGSSETRRKIYDLGGFERSIRILEGFGWMFYFDLCIPLLLTHGSCLASFAALGAFCFSAGLQRSSSMKKQIKLIMTWWEEDDYKEVGSGEELRTEKEKAEDQLRIEEEKAEDQSRIEEEEKAEDQSRIEEEEKAEDMKKWMVLKAREDEIKNEEEARREEMMKKVVEKLKKEKEKHKGYRKKWEEEKEEKARLNAELCAATKWAEYCQTFLQNYEEERRKWEEERKELTAKLYAAQDSSNLYQQLLHECSSSF